MSILKIEVQCGLCGTFTEVIFYKNYGFWTGMCPNKECQSWVVMRTNIQSDVKESNTIVPKTCNECGIVWVRRHVCKISIGNKLSNELQLLQIQDRSKPDKNTTTQERQS